MLFLVALLVDGALTGALYALIALTFVVVYRASRMINFALGEWTMLAAGLVAVGLNAFGLGLVPSLGVACLGMIGLGVGLNHVVLRPLVGRPLIAVIMVTLGLGALIRGVSSLAFRGIPGRITLPLPADPMMVFGVAVPADKALAAVAAVLAVALTAWFFHSSRTGVALRAIADDSETAMAVGIDVQRYFAITWGMVGVLSVLAGTLWTLAAGGGFGVVLVGLRVFPIVIIGGLDSIAGAIVGAVFVGVLESLAAGYLDSYVGGGFSTVASYLVLVAMLFARPYGLFGRPEIARV